MFDWPDQDPPKQPKQRTRGDGWWPCGLVALGLAALPVAAVLAAVEVLS